MNRRNVLRAAATALAFGIGSRRGSSALAQTPIALTDIAGRTITLPHAARRILLAQGRQLPALALAHSAPVSLLVGLGGEFQRQDPETYALYRERFPELDAIARIGDGTAANFPVELAIAAGPDVIIASRSFIGSLDAAGSSVLIRQMAAAGIAVVIADFHTRPLQDTLPSLRVLGELLGEAQAAQAFGQFYSTRLERIRSRLAQAAPRIPTVFMHAHAGGMPCCFTPGRGTFNDYIAAAGGHNIGSDMVPGVSGQLSLEQVLASDAEFYVATGGTHLASRGGLVLGTGVGERQARASFATLLKQPGISGLSAVAGGRAFGLWQSFTDTPLHIVAIEALARWFHPELFADLDPDRSLSEINSRFLPVPLRGVYWTSST
ncbi:ABC transporter substrate-binding protein [Bosea sp. 685]|uniref:ABC transporter substrate-binding protein n=1 Tax=Bosea sp. 685 TaxID=3080057 RepID=UPI00289357C3|nr:ABC transporter substrate-binding protein [Bosea sp. 685]WNJ93121.1 ABC transporter substrate-binding protein [Bosea sp. 685]